MKIIDFVKNNKVPTIATSVVLVAAVAVGVTFGVLNHRDNIETNEPFGNESSSKGSSSTISVPPIEDNSSAESTSSEDSTSSASETIETNSTPSKAESVSSAQVSSKTTTIASKPTASKPSNTTSSKPTTSTPSNGGNTGTSKPSTSTPSGENTGLGSGSTTTEGDGWHLNITVDCSTCGKEYNAELDACPYCGAEYDYGNCPNCGRPWGDGSNGTCDPYRNPLPPFNWICRHDN